MAAILTEFPDIGMQVHGETGRLHYAPPALAEFFQRRKDRDVQELCDHLARNRATACVEALVLRGIRRSRLVATFRSRTGHPRCDFIPQSVDEVAKKRAAGAVRRLVSAQEAAQRLAAFLGANVRRDALEPALGCINAC